MSEKTLLIIGAGGLGEVVGETALESLSEEDIRNLFF